MAEYVMNLPIKNEDVEKLKLGDTIYLNGIVYTARDMGHLEIKKLYGENKPLPEDLKGSAIFHAGPVCIKDGNKWKMNVIGPTTSIRMEPYADLIGKIGVKMIIGKGGLAEDSLKAFKEYKQVYLQAPPGCAVVIADGVKNIKRVHWLENGMPEAMWVLEVQNFGPFIVAMDAHGNSIYNNIAKKAEKAIENSKLLKDV